MLTVPPRLTPGDWSAFSDVDRNIDADRRALAEPHEVDMQRQIADRVELEIARDDAVLHAVDLDVVNGGEKMPGIDALAQIGVIERDRQRRLAVAIDDSGYAAGATFCPGGPLAGPERAAALIRLTVAMVYPVLALFLEIAAAASRGAVAGAAVARL